jgi:hypothetical protein
MKTFLAIVTLISSSLPVFAADEIAPRQDSKAPLMVSFADLKWTELPERKGMQFAVLSGDPKTGEYTQIRKVPAGTDNPLHSHSSEIKNESLAAFGTPVRTRPAPKTSAQDRW